MDNTRPCFCGTKRLSVEDAAIVLNEIPICNLQCLAKAEKALTNKKDTVTAKKPWSWNGA